MAKASYYTPFTTRHTIRSGAWTIEIGDTADGEWVASYTSTANPRPQRQYYATEAEALADAEKFCRF